MQFSESSIPGREIVLISEGRVVKHGDLVRSNVVVVRTVPFPWFFHIGLVFSSISLYGSSTKYQISCDQMVSITNGLEYFDNVISPVACFMRRWIGRQLLHQIVGPPLQIDWDSPWHMVCYRLNGILHIA